MFQIVVFFVPCFDFFFQFFQIFEFISFIKFLLILAVASFHGSVLSRLARINQVMNDVVSLAEQIKIMQSGVHRVGLKFPLGLFSAWLISAPNRLLPASFISPTLFSSFFY